MDDLFDEQRATSLNEGPLLTSLGKQLGKLEIFCKGVSEQLPISGSMIALDIINGVVAAYLEDQELTVNDLWKRLPHSSTGIRTQFNRLIEGGWIKTIKKDGGDSRIKLVIPTNNLLDCYRNLINSSERFFLD